jgi:hypothetical protein
MRRHNSGTGHLAGDPLVLAGRGMVLWLSLARAHGAALGPRTTGKPWTTAASDGQPIVLVSSRFRAFAQVTQ